MANIKTRCGSGRLKLHSALFALIVCAFSLLAFPIFAKASVATTSVTAGAFTITGDNPTEGTDYTYTGTPGVDGYLCIISEKELTIKNTNPEATSDLIVVSLPDGLTEAHVILAGVNIVASQYSALTINGEASISSFSDVSFDTYITLQDDTVNTLSSYDEAGLYFKLTINAQENGSLTLQGDGTLVCNGENGAGIGGRGYNTVKNISILSGIIISSSNQGAGIGGGEGAGATNLSFLGGTIEASSLSGSGVGGAGDLTSWANVSNIRIENCLIKAIGGGTSSGIGFGQRGASTDNLISGNAVVMACVGCPTGSTPIRPALLGFTITSGIIYTGTQEYDTSSGEFAPAETRWDTGYVAGTGVTVLYDVALPFELTINSDQTVRVAEGVTLSADDGVALDIQGTLENSGTITIPSDNLSCSGNGKVTTKVSYDTRGGTFVPVSNDTLPSDIRTYKDANSSDIHTYGTLPTATLAGKDFAGWYIKQNDQVVDVTKDSEVMLNEHNFMANYEDTKTVSLTFDASPGVFSSTGLYTYAKEGLIPGSTFDLTSVEVPQREGYTFSGWYTKDGVKVNDTYSVRSISLVLVAHWDEVPAPTPSDTGWSQDDIGWQYRDENGNLTHGWLNLDGTWYYFDDAGYAIHDMWLWNEDFGPHWYYFWNNCAMATNAWLWDGAWYWVCSTGPMIQGLWQWIDNAWYGFLWNGQMCTGWVWDNAYVAWFYCYNNGVVARNTWVDGYYLNNSGICL